MGVVRWNIQASDIDDFDRSKQIKPYTGPIPPSRAVYLFRIKTMKYAAATRDKLEQLRVGLELVPRRGMDEKKYAGYFMMMFIPVAPNTGFRYVPLCDAIGVNGRDFTERMHVDRDGNVQRIGKWRHDGKQEVLAQLVDGSDEKGNYRQEVGTIMSPDEADYDDDSDEFDGDDEEFEDDEYADDEEDEGF
jgi:hypothetical protein